MFPSMMNSGFASGLQIFLVLHILSILAFSFGILFLVFWAFKALSGPDLWKWGWILVVAAVILCLLSIIASPFRGFGFRDGFDGMKKMKWSTGCSANTDRDDGEEMEMQEAPAGMMMKMMQK